MRELLGLGRLQHQLGHCRICSRMSVHRIQVAAAARRRSSIARTVLGSLKVCDRTVLITREYHSLTGHIVERLRGNSSKLFKRGAVFSNCLLRDLTSRHLFKSPPTTATKMTLAGGGLLCGGLGLLFANNHHQTAAHCQDESESGSETQTQNCDRFSELTLAQTPISELSFLQQLKLVVRFVYLSFLFSPAALLCGVSYLTGNEELTNLAWRYVFFAIQMAGPAFIKLGQWASTRRDIFSESFCTTLSKLHTRCNPHSWSSTDKIMKENLGDDWKESVVILNQNAIGSGCVAQVYQGYLKVQDNADKADTAVNKSDSGGDTGLKEAASKEAEHGYVPIAVKVLHPGVVEAMDADVRLMKYAATWVDYFYPDVHWIALKECVDEFSIIMQQQLDLKLEARNLQKFQHLMDSYDCIKFPTPIHPYVTNSVLVESYESGTQISEYLNNPGGELQRELARIGVEVVLDMLFVHNFVHGDLHPGNILVQDPSVDDPKLVLLDCGIATSLGPIDLENFHSVFTAIVKGEGAKVADLFLGVQSCATVDEYRQAMADLVNTSIQRLNLKETEVSTLFSKVFDILIEHKVRIEPKYTSVMVAMMIIEGLGRSLDPSLDLLEYAKPCVLNRAKKYLREQVGKRIAMATERVERMKRNLSLGEEPSS